MSMTEERVRPPAVEEVPRFPAERRSPGRRAGMWVLWSPGHLAAAVIGGLVVIFVLRVVAGGGAPPASRPVAAPAPSGPVVAAGPAAAVALPAPVVGGPASTVIVSTVPAAALTAAARFVAVWASHTDRVTWLASVDALATPTLRVELSGVDPASVPAHQVTGPAVGLGDSSGGTVRVPTDIGDVAVIITDAGGTWQAATVEPLVP